MTDINLDELRPKDIVRVVGSGAHVLFEKTKVILNLGDEAMVCEDKRQETGKFVLLGRSGDYRSAYLEVDYAILVACFRLIKS